MALSENIAERLTYKFYADPAIAATEPAPATAPAATGGQQLRHVSHSIALTKDYYRPNEKRADRTMAMGRHGVRRAPGAISGMLSLDTYSELFEASLQGTWAAGVELTESDLTSVAADNATSKLTAAAGDPVALGLRIGDVIRFADLSEADNNATNFLILNFGGTSNREITVYPAPEDMSADSAFTLTASPSLARPTASHVRRKLAVEVFNPDSDIAELYTEGRLGGFDLALPPNDNATVNFNGLWRGRTKYATSAAPFFTDPTAPTTTGILAGVNGRIYINGSAVGVLTNFSLSCAMQLAGPAVIGALGLIPDVLLDAMDVSGNVQALLQDATLSDLFDDENEVSLLAYLIANSDANSPAMTLYLPRIKLNSDTRSDGPELAKVVSHDFAAATYEGSAAGVPGTVLRMVDTEVTA